MDQTLAEDICLEWATEAETETDDENPPNSENSDVQGTVFGSSGVPIKHKYELLDERSAISIKQEECSLGGENGEHSNSEEGQSDSLLVRNNHFKKKRRWDKSKQGEQASEEDNGSYTCHFCFLVFSVKEDLKYHVSTCHRKDLILRCDVCAVTFPDKIEFFDHMAKHQTENYTRCDLCLINFKSENKLAQHVLSVHFSGTSFVCEFCDKTFTKKGELLSHKFEEHASIDYNCADCGAQFCQKSLLAQHIKKVHMERTYSCRLCNALFQNKYNLLRHVKLHSRKKKQKKYSCNSCDAHFTFQRTLTSHNLVCKGQNIESLELVEVHESDKIIVQALEKSDENLEEKNPDTFQHSSPQASTSTLVFNGSAQQMTTISPSVKPGTESTVPNKSNEGDLILLDLIKTNNVLRSKPVLPNFIRTLHEDPMEIRNYIPVSASEELLLDSQLQDICEINSPTSDTIVPDHTIVSDQLYAVAHSTLVSQNSDMSTLNCLLNDPSDCSLINTVLPEDSDLSIVIENLPSNSDASLSNAVLPSVGSEPADKMLPNSSESTTASSLTQNSNEELPIVSTPISFDIGLPSSAPEEIPSSSVLGNSLSTSKSASPQDKSVPAPNNSMHNHSSVAEVENFKNPEAETFDPNITTSLISEDSVSQTKTNELTESYTKTPLPQTDNIPQSMRLKKRPRLLSEHIKRALSYRALKDEGQPQSIFVENFGCKICGAEFAFKYDLLKHIRLHTANYKCDRCDAAFAKQEELAKHTLTSHFRRSGRTGVNLLANLFTDKLNKARQMSGLMQKVSQETYTCDNCAATFGFESELMYHMLIHGDDFKCDKCKASFREKSELAKHLLLAAHF